MTLTSNGIVIPSTFEPVSSGIKTNPVNSFVIIDPHSERNGKMTTAVDVTIANNSGSSTSNSSGSSSSCDTQEDAKLLSSEEKIRALERELKVTRQKLLASQTNSVDLETKYSKVQKELAKSDKWKVEYLRVTEDNKKKDYDLKMFQSNVALVLKQLEEVKRELSTTKASESKLRFSSSQKISYGPFSTSDTVLFLKNSQGFYEAYNRGYPHRYLSDESKTISKSSDQVIGTIVVMVKFKTGKTKSTNPYNLNPGDEFYRITVELVQDLTVEKIEK